MRRRRGGVLAALLLLPAAAAARMPPPAIGTLRVCDDVKEPATLDPLKEFSEKNHVVIQQIFDGLVRIGPDGALEPALATSWKWLDDRTLQFKLRPGVRFHDREPFDAQAVRFSLQKYLDPAEGYPGAGFLRSIDRVEVVDPMTVRIHTKFPDGILLNKLAGLITMLPPRYFSEHGEAYFAAHPVGTGAFRFLRRVPGRRLILAANPDYWMKGYPRFARLEFLFMPVPEQVRALLDGRTDIVTELPGTQTLRVMRSGVATVVKKASFYTAGSSINISSGPLSDVRVRRAINYAIDRSALVRYDLLGNGEPLASLTMAGEVGHDPTLRPYPYEPRRAISLLRQAGYPHGLRLSVVVKAQGERTMKVLAAQLREVGIRLDVHPTTDATVIRDIHSRPWDFTFGNCSDPMAHSYFVQWIFLSSQSPFSITRSPRFDALLRRMVEAVDPAEQQRRGEELDRYVYDQALSVFTYKRIRTYGVRKGIHFVPSVTGMPYFYLTTHDDAGASR
ncbi:MAG: ABC transporter substrate-binding protein [Elusimicrobia bacterium]|nr:ABC transporter substrate-binding protein [Elusimicrobiota bacterium]